MVSKEILKQEINEILKNADLSVLSAKKVRLQLQEKLKCDLLNQKDEIDTIVMDFVNSKDDESEKSDQESESEEEIAPKRKALPPKKSTKKKKTEKSGSDHDDGCTEEYSLRKTKVSVKKRSSDTVTTKNVSSKGKGRATGFTRAYKLSPELAAFMGADAMPRHEVVKKMWAVIKERNLLDPKNKQFAICDEEIHKIMGVKKFRTFGMLKYLKTHFLD